jgi:arsenate reductase (thioredoxin)
MSDNLGKTKVLFLCTGNSARSHIGEALLRHHVGDHFEVHSAGLEPKGLNPYTIRVMTEIGIDMSGHHSKDVTEYLGKTSFGYLIIVCGHAEQNCPTTFLGAAQRLSWPFDDPAAATGTDEEILAKFREVRDQMDERIHAWLTVQGLTVKEVSA